MGLLLVVTGGGCEVAAWAQAEWMRVGSQCGLGGWREALVREKMGKLDPVKARRWHYEAISTLSSGSSPVVMRDALKRERSSEWRSGGES